MKTTADYLPPFSRLIEVMEEQLGKPENREKYSWYDATFEELDEALDRNLRELRAQTWRGPLFDEQEVWKRAANVANFSWMIADRATKRSPR